MFRPFAQLEIFTRSGSFIFGTDKPVVEGDGEEPAREVLLSKDYFIDAYEVPNSEFWIFAQETKYKTEGLSRYKSRTLL